ncbi:cysteine protease rdl2-related [Anaeramoeba flamelloides]|uniref:Cysteine protease rdl2-related n=1 Tax=Anaeramoeba flamelloides TaxID=1746091 RepID=A0AAV7ZFM7_9EUKA|nr:cysteine protease rdl2-related [Anaeramoeba flamelloides]
MKKLFVFFLVLFLFFLTVSSKKQPNTEFVWYKFKKKFNRNYDPLEESKRFAIFQDNLRLIKKHNNNPSHGFKLGINQFADLTNEEYQKKYLFKYNSDEKKYLKQEKVYDQKNLKNVPDSLDLRQDGMVTPIQDMGQCEGCWSFAIIAAIEGCVAKETDQLIKLSEQELIDCDYYPIIGQKGCNSGSTFKGMDWIIDNGGVTSLENYPYVGYTNNCGGTSGSVSTITGYHQVINTEDSVKTALFDEGPLFCTVDAHTYKFQLYKGGLFYDSNCSAKKSDLNHSMTIVGYGSDTFSNSDNDYDSPSDKYWIVKNSWGTTFGDDGYVYMSRGSNNCGILTEAYYPSGCSLV